MARMLLLGIALAGASVANAGKPGAGGSTTTTYPAGTQWYQVPDVEKLRAELAAGICSGADRAAKAKVVEDYDIMNKTYQKIGMARTDGKPPLFKGKLMNC